jgi:hypothetical protein
MTVGRVRQVGRGYYQARLAVAGWPYEAVTGNALERTATDGRLRRTGLDLAGVILQARADIATARLDTQGFRAALDDLRRAKVDGTRGRVWTDAFRRPQASTTLRSNLTTGATTIDVHDTSQFPAAGYIHVGTEAIAYSGKTATTFTGLTRGVWGTIAQAHFIPDGERLQYPVVADRPLSLEGRRAELYLYGPGDDPQGTGTLRWIGICATDAAYDGEGRWSFTVDPITRLLAQQIGGDLAESVPARGILHPWAAPAIITLVNRTLGRTVKVAFAGFWETQDLFCAAATSAIAAAIASSSGWSSLWASGSSIVAQASSDDRTSFRLVYTVGTGAGAASEIWVALDGIGDITRISDGPYGWRDGDGNIVDSPVPGGIYHRVIDAPIPRGSGSGPPLTADTLLATGAVPVDLHRRLYLGGLVVPSTGMTARVEDGTGGEGYMLTITGVNATDRYLEVAGSIPPITPQTRIRLGRRLAVGNLETLRAAIAAQSPGLANTGAMPLIGGTDIVPATEVTEAAASNPLGASRVFEAYEGIELAEIVEHELRALGCYQRLGASGAIEWARIRISMVTDDADVTASITDADIKGPVRVERAQYGTIGVVVYRIGYDPAEGKHRSSITARDVQATAPARTSRAHEIAQRSFPESRVSGGDWWAHSPPEAAPEDVARLAFPIFGIFGSSYDVWTLPVGPRRQAVRIGDSVSITSTRIPDADTGLLGVTARVGLVTGVVEDLSTGQVTLEVLVHGQRFAGYAPGVEVSSQTNISGNIWDVTCAAVATYIDSADLRDHFRVGDLVRVTQFDSAAPTEVTGTVTAENSATQVRVTFDGVWTPGGSTWMLRSRASTSYASTDRVAGYAFQADATTRLVDHTPTDATAKVFAA